MLYMRCGFRPILLVMLLLAAALAQAQPMRPPELPAPEPVQAGAEPGYLGMIVDDRQENGQGVRVKDVDPESPAAKAGLQAEDLVTAINGKAVHSDEDVGQILRPLQAGAKVTFQFDRQGKSQNVEATLGRRPPPDQRRFQNFGRLPEAPAGGTGQPSAGQSGSGQSPVGPYPSGPSSLSGQSSQPGDMSPRRIDVGSLSRPVLGVRTLPVTEQDRIRLGLPSTAGAHVMARTMNSPAEKANIPLDAVITAVNGTPVGTPTDLSALLVRAGAGSEIELTYFYNGNSVQTKLTLGSIGAGRDISRSGLGGQGTANSPMAGNPGMANSAPAANGSATWPPSTPSPIFNPSRQNDAGPRQNNAGSRQNDSGSRADTQRIEALERRVQELEQKVQELEKHQQPGT